MITLKRGDVVVLRETGLKLIVKDNADVDDPGWYMGDAGAWLQPFHISTVRTLERQVHIHEGCGLTEILSFVHTARDDPSFHDTEHELDGMIT